MAGVAGDASTQTTGMVATLSTAPSLDPARKGGGAALRGNGRADISAAFAFGHRAAGALAIPVVALAVIVVLALPGAATFTVTLEAPAEPLPLISPGPPVTATFALDCASALAYSAGNSGAAAVPVEIVPATLPPGLAIENLPAAALPVGPCQTDPQGSTRATVPLQVLASGAALGLRPLPVRVDASVPGAIVAGQSAAPPQSANATATVQVAPVLLVQAAPSAISYDADARPTPFSVRVENLGNVPLRVRLVPGAASVPPPEPVTLGTPLDPTGPATNATLPMSFEPPQGDWILADVTITVTPSADGAGRTWTGTPANVTVRFHNRLTVEDAPGPAAPWGLAMVLACAAVLRGRGARAAK